MNWYREFERCLDKRWLVRMPEARYLVTKELKVAQDDLAEAEAGYQRGSYKWSTIRSHYCLSMAMRHLFVSEGMLSETLIDNMDDARALREDADYRSEFSETGARHNLDAARRLIEQVSELLIGWEEPSE